MKFAIPSILILFALVLIIRQAFTGAKETIIECDKEKSLAISGVIEAIEPDAVNRAQKTIRLTNGTVLKQIFTIGLWNHVKPGDSLVKKPGTLNYKIYKAPQFSSAEELLWDKQCQ